MRTLSRSPNLEEVIRFAVENRLSQVHVALPGLVDSYNSEKQLVDVLPLLPNIVINDDDTQTTEEIPIITEVPLIFPRTGEFFISFPIKKGDHVLLVFNERSIDKFVESSGEKVENTTHVRMHDLSDAVAYPGFFPNQKALKSADEENLALGHDSGKQIHIKQDEVHLGKKDPSDFVALASLVKAEFSRIANIFDNHIHVTSATVGASTTVGTIVKTVTPMSPVSDVKSDVVKSE